MALFMTGLPCQICGKPIQGVDEATIFPAFLPGTHPLWRYSDSVFHAACFQSDPHRRDVERLLQKRQDHWARRPPSYNDKEAVEKWYDEWLKILAADPASTKQPGDKA
jgi:hypothetical protein